MRRKALLGLATVSVVAACSAPVAAFAYGQGSTDPSTSVSTDPGFDGSVPEGGSSSGGGDSLPLTGDDAARLAVIGLAVAGTGVALAASRKRRAADA